MKVLLIKDVKALGKAGEVKEVKDGYGNNFLIAKGFAKAATDAVLKQYASEQKRAEEAKNYEIAQAQSLATELSKITIKIKSKLGANGQLFGSITKDEISVAIKAQTHYEIDKKSLEIPHIKTPGKYEISAKLGHSLTAKFALEVVGE